MTEYKHKHLTREEYLKWRSRQDSNENFLWKAAAKRLGELSHAGIDVGKFAVGVEGKMIFHYDPR